MICRPINIICERQTNIRKAYRAVRQTETAYEFVYMVPARAIYSKQQSRQLWRTHYQLHRCEHISDQQQTPGNILSQVLDFPWQFTVVHWNFLTTAWKTRYLGCLASGTRQIVQNKPKQRQGLISEPVAASTLLRLFSEAHSTHQLILFRVYNFTGSSKTSTALFLFVVNINLFFGNWKAMFMETGLQRKMAMI